MLDPIGPGLRMGRYPLCRRFNMDQVPFNLDCLAKRSFHPAREVAIVPTCGSNATKRFGTVHVTIHGSPGQRQCRPAIIFKAKEGSKLLEKERGGYHPGVSVFSTRVRGLRKSSSTIGSARSGSPTLTT